MNKLKIYVKRSKTPCEGRRGVNSACQSSSDSILDVSPMKYSTYFILHDAIIFHNSFFAQSIKGSPISLSQIPDD